MRLTALIIAAVLGLSCANTITTPDGHTLNLEGVDVDPNQIDIAVRYYASQIIWLGFVRPKDVGDAVDKLHFTLVAGRFHVPWANDLKNGMQDGKHIKLAWSDYGVAGSALFHELHHRVDQVAFERYDLDHSNEDWWAYVRIIKGGWNDL